MQKENEAKEPLSNVNRHEEDRLGILLSRAVSVWLWSILLGGTTGLTYYWSFYFPGRSWSQASVMLVLSTAITICLAATWVYLFLHLKDAIIPDVVYRSEMVPDAAARHLAGQRLKRAYLFMIVAGVLGLVSRSIVTCFNVQPSMRSVTYSESIDMDDPEWSMSGKETIEVPLNEVVAIKSGEKEILIIFSNHPEEHPTKLNRKIYKWRSIERTDGNRYRLISEGTNDLYEGDYSRKRFRAKQVKDKTLIEIDGLRMPWSFSSDFDGGYLYYDDEKFSIKITGLSSFDEYLKGSERVE